MLPENVDANVKKVISQRDKDRAYFLKNFISLIIKYDHFVLFPHVGPDGDCLGCVFGLQELIHTNFPNKRAYVVGDSNGLFPWLNMKFDNFINYSFDFSNSVAIILDVGTSNRIQRFERFFKSSKVRFGCVVKIDHHGSISDFHVDLSWDDPTYAASCCQVIQIADFYGWQMTPLAATFLYLGTCTDSLRFSTETVLPRTLILAAKSWRAGADHVTIHRHLLRRTWHSITVANHLLEKCNKTENIIWYYLSRDEINQLHILNPKGLVSVFQDIEEHWIWILFVEGETGMINIDFRSSHVGVRDLAIKYGGGGHENASGARIEKDQIPAVVADAEKIVADAKKKMKESMEATISDLEAKEREMAEKAELIKSAPEVIESTKKFLEESMASRGETGGIPEEDEENKEGTA